MTLLSILLVLVAPAPSPAPAQPAPTPAAPGQPATGTPAPAGEPGQVDQGTQIDPASGEDQVMGVDVRATTLSDDYEPPFPSEDLQLSGVLQEAAKNNYDLAINQVDIKISEQSVLQAIGVYDVFLTAGLNASLTETPRRGSQFVFSFGSRSVGGNVGFNRRLETGGQITFTVNASRTITRQPTNPFGDSLNSTDLTSYTIAPTLQLTQPLLQGAGLKVNRAEINKAKIAITQSEATRQVTSQNAVRDLISAYWDVLFAHRDLENKRRSVALARQQLDRTRALVAAGRVSPVDVKGVEQALAAREGEVLTAENNLLDRSLTLRTLMGQNFADRDVLGVLPQTDPMVRPRTVNVRDEVNRALQANPQVRGLELAIASRRIDELVAANRRLPQLDFQGTFAPQGRSVDENADAGTGDPGREGNWGEAFRNIFSEDVRSEGLLADWSISGALSLTWDVQNRGPKAQHEIAKLQIERAELQLAQARSQVSGNVIRSANTLRTAGKQIEVAQVSMDLAEENLAAEQARYEVGRSTNFDVLLRLDELDAAAAQALNAQVAYLKALVQLQALTGEILPAYGLQ